jgi:hypothetical protein
MEVQTELRLFNKQRAITLKGRWPPKESGTIVLYLESSDKNAFIPSQDLLSANEL